MTTLPDVGAPARPPEGRSAGTGPPGIVDTDPGMIATRFMELRKRRGLMIALTDGDRRHTHDLSRRPADPARGRAEVLRAGRRVHIFTALFAGVLYIFGFIVAATLGCTAGSVDLTDGMFRHHVVTGRSRLALYLARIPAGLAIIIPLVAIGFTIVCAVCVFAAPAKLSYAGHQRAHRAVPQPVRDLRRRARQRDYLRPPLRRPTPGRPHLWQRSRAAPPAP